LETAYRSVSFKNHETMTRDLMDQIEQNLQYVKDNTPRGRLFKKTNKGVILKDDLLVIIAGKVKIPRNRKSSSARATVKFGAAFASNCTPNVTTAICADHQRTIFCIVNGPAGQTLPDHTGFEVHCSVQDDPTTKKTDVIKKDFWVHWIAMGFRTDDLNEF
jgi:hypothetical protein